MIVTVTPNPALDLTWHVDGLRPGETHRVPAGATRAGGKGINVARVLHEQGVPVLALTTFGGAAGSEFAADLAVGGVPHRLVPVGGATRRSVAIVDTDAAHTAVLNERGAALTDAEADALDAVAVEAATAAAAASAARAARRRDVAVISGSLPPGYGPERIGGLVHRLGQTGARVVVDTSGPALLEAARAGAYALKPNAEELAAATGITDPEEGALLLLDLGATLVMVSQGGDGLMLVSRAEQRRPVRARLPRVLRGNATGAGDAAVAALAAGLAAPLPFDADIAPAAAARRSLVRRAVAWSASAVLVPVAGSLAPEHEALEREVLVDPAPAKPLQPDTTAHRSPENAEEPA
ncbi:1-phosphofructokinase family hexose kinase [Agromyces sp. NPDC058110]|uniref:1-phosphofructokinase family hexose kinase n=1 Tax=Agromyces sp. NPDC058110 TaxID=3346345 RepID=UPI0036DB8B34